MNMNGLWNKSKSQGTYTGYRLPEHLCRILGYHRFFFVVVGCSDQYEYVGRQFHGIQVLEWHGIHGLDIRQKWS